MVPKSVSLLICSKQRGGQGRGVGNSTSSAALSREDTRGTQEKHNVDGHEISVYCGAAQRVHEGGGCGEGSGAIMSRLALLALLLSGCGGAQSLADFKRDMSLQECARMGSTVNCVKATALCSDPKATRYFVTVDSEGNVSDYSVSK